MPLRVRLIHLFKIAQEYDSPVVYVEDASKVVGVISDLLNDQRKSVFIAQNKKEQEEISRYYFEQRQKKKLLPFKEAEKYSYSYDVAGSIIHSPNKTGIFVIKDASLEMISRYIDWTPLFLAWDIKGRYPRILEDPKLGQQAKELYFRCFYIIKKDHKRKEI